MRVFSRLDVAHRHRALWLHHPLRARVMLWGRSLFRNFEKDEFLLYVSHLTCRAFLLYSMLHRSIHHRWEESQIRTFPWGHAYRALFFLLWELYFLFHCMQGWRRKWDALLEYQKKCTFTLLYIDTIFWYFEDSVRFRDVRSGTFLSRWLTIIDNMEASLGSFTSAIRTELLDIFFWNIRMSFFPIIGIQIRYDDILSWFHGVWNPAFEIAIEFFVMHLYIVVYLKMEDRMCFRDRIDHSAEEMLDSIESCTMDTDKEWRIWCFDVNVDESRISFYRELRNSYVHTSEKRFHEQSNGIEHTEYWKIFCPIIQKKAKKWNQSIYFLRRSINLLFCVVTFPESRTII